MKLIEITIVKKKITSKTPRSSGRSKHLPLRTGFAFDGNLKDYGPELELTSNTGKPIKSAFTCPSFVQLDPFTVRFSLLRNLKNTFDSSSLTLDNLEEMKTRIIKLEEGSFDTVLKTGKKIAGRNWEKIERACGLNGIEKTGWTNLSLAHTRVEMNVSPISTIIFRNSFSDRSMRNSRPTTSNGNYDDDMPSLRPVSSARSWADIARGSPGSPSSHR